MADGLTRPLVVERRTVDGELPENVLTGVFSHDDVEFSRDLERGNVVEGRLGDVDFSGLEPRQPRLRFRHDRDDQAIHVGSAFVRGQLAKVSVVAVPGENDLVALGPGDELPGTRADCRCCAKTGRAVVRIADD